MRSCGLSSNISSSVSNVPSYSILSSIKRRTRTQIETQQPEGPRKKRIYFINDVGTYIHAQLWINLCTTVDTIGGLLLYTRGGSVGVMLRLGGICRFYTGARKCGKRREKASKADSSPPSQHQPLNANAQKRKRESPPGFATYFHATRRWACSARQGSIDEHPNVVTWAQKNKRNAEAMSMVHIYTGKASDVGITISRRLKKTKENITKGNNSHAC